MYDHSMTDGERRLLTTGEMDVNNRENPSPPSSYLASTTNFLSSTAWLLM